jgi:hypothetical protein
MIKMMVGQYRSVDRSNTNSQVLYIFGEGTRSASVKKKIVTFELDVER